MPVGRITVLMAVAFMATCCSPGEEAPSQNKCAATLYPSYNPKIMDQCIGVCLRCDRGTQTTCSTSCTLRGAK